MGRAQKQRVARRAARADAIELDELDYLRLSQVRGRINEAVLQGRAEVEQAQGLANQRIAGAQKALQEQFAKLQKKYKLDPKTAYSFDDKRCLLIPVDKT